MASAEFDVANVLVVSHANRPDLAGAVRSLTDALEASKRFAISVVSATANGVPALANLSASDFQVVLVLADVEPSLPGKQLAGLERFVKAGGGLVVCHQGARALSDNEAIAALLGVKLSLPSPVPFDYRVRFAPQAVEAGHPLAVRCEDFTAFDTFIPVEAGEGAQVFAESYLDHRTMPVGVSMSKDKARSVYLAIGGTARTLRDRYFHRMVERALRHVRGESFSGTVNAGIIGYGGAFNMGLAHANAINAQFGMQAVAVCDLDKSRLAQAREELGDGITTYSKMEELLADKTIDLVVVILPHNLHADVCVAAAKAGKHVVTEKPFSITINEADRMIAAAREAGTMVSCFHNRRWDGDFLDILERVRGGVIGEVFHIDAASAGWGMPGQWWRSSKQVSGGTLYDWGAHYMDWTLNLIPKRIESVSGNLHKRFWYNSTNEDFGQVTVRFEDGTTATLEQGNLAAIPRAGWRILGTGGAMSNEGPGGQITLVQRRGGLNETATIKPRRDNWSGFYKNIGNHLIMDEPLIVTETQARRTIAVLELAEKSSTQGGKPLPLPGEDNFDPDYIMPW